ncbi:MAG: xanthine dehydrogenase accessory protein XdhC [Devosia sp.]
MEVALLAEPNSRHARDVPAPAGHAALWQLAHVEPTAVVLLEEAHGSTPRETGAWMIVTAEETIGTIGGGEAELRSMELARKLLVDGKPHTTVKLPLGPQLGQCCGGHMKVAIARVEAEAVREALRTGALPLWDDGPVALERRGRPVVVYGAGHVGAALVAALEPLPFAITWVDARAEVTWPTVGRTPCRRLAIPEEAATAAPDEAAHVVMTHSHALDLEIVAAVLQRPFAFLGLIGSGTKRTIFERRLRERGIDPTGLVCPIGLSAVRGKEPAVIAAATAAQLLTLPR